MVQVLYRPLGRLIVLCVAALVTPLALASPHNVLADIHHNQLLKSTIPKNGDVNPYAVIIAPASAGAVHKGDVLIDNFNDKKNL